MSGTPDPEQDPRYDLIQVTEWITPDGGTGDPARVVKRELIYRERKPIVTGDPHRPRRA